MSSERVTLNDKHVTWPELQEKIKARYSSLSKRLQQVGAYILENPKMVAFETIAVISEQMNVPPSTLIRFASALGFSGFNELKNIVKDDMLEQTTDYSNRIQLMRNEDNWHDNQLLTRFAKANRNALHHLQDNISEEDMRRAIKMMADARHIFLLGNGRAHTVSTYLHYALNHINRRVFLISGTGGMFREQMSNVEVDDLLLAISYSPYSSQTRELTTEAFQKGVKVLSITDSPVSPLARVSHLSFVVHEARVDAFRSLSASLVLAQVLTISLADMSQSDSAPPI